MQKGKVALCRISQTLKGTEVPWASCVKAASDSVSLGWVLNCALLTSSWVCGCRLWVPTQVNSVLSQAVYVSLCCPSGLPLIYVLIHSSTFISFYYVPGPVLGSG